MPISADLTAYLYSLLRQMEKQQLPLEINTGTPILRAMRKLFKFLLAVIVIFLLLFIFYFNNTSLVDPKTAAFYAQLKDTLKAKGYNAKLLVVSTKRVRFHNYLLVKFSRAAPKSKHLDGDALDMIVFDVNNDGSSNSKDVDLVYSILDSKIVGNKGGIGTYKNENSFFVRQIIRIDCRGYRARWNY